MLAAERVFRPVRLRNALRGNPAGDIACPNKTASCSNGMGCDKGAEKWYSQR